MDFSSHEAYEAWFQAVRRGVRLRAVTLSEAHEENVFKMFQQGLTVAAAVHELGRIR